MIKNTDESSDEEVYKVRSGSVLVELEGTTFNCAQTWKLWNLVVWGYLWRLHHIDMIDYKSISDPSLFPGE